jgi:hydroxyacylglutathione hydrolase
MTLEIVRVPALSDNYIWLVHEPGSGETMVVDPAEAAPVLAAADSRGWRITQIWNTHWHPDHTGGNAAIKAATGCEVFAPAAEVAKIAGVDRPVSGGDTIRIGAWRAEVIDVGGHTNGHVAYHLPEAGLAFVGDSLFALGCGRMFEGTAPQFWASLSRLKALPPETLLYCAHEYTQSNARFALHADPDNAALRAYADDVDRKRAAGIPTVPTRLDRELAANPFLRADTDEMRTRWGGSEPSETFAALRAAKDAF